MMSKMILVFVGLLGLAGYGSAQIVQVGQCDGLTSMANFDLAQFTNPWFEVGKASSQIGDCSTLQFTSNAATGAITVSNPSVVNNFLQTATGSATLAAGTSRFTVTLAPTNTPFEFWVLNTDYTNYAIAYNCVNVGTTQRTLNVWQLGRAVNSFDTPATLAAANAALQPLGLTVNSLQSVDHSTSACTQLPVIGDGQPIILQGQCNNAAIPIVQSFRVADFTGTWYEMSSYYSVNAVGTCARAQYDLVGSTVNVVNSQVLNGRLDTITGTATLSGTDGAGRLNVVLNVQGTQVTQELLIIDTDYTGYAVSYTCVDLPNNQRQVNSWILSKTRQISAASQVEVNRVISSLVDLNTEYYRNTDQSDDGCFYYPVFQPGVPVVFPGQCDENIPVQANFDPTRYVNLWHDIESYPSTFQQGTCNNAFYTLTPQSTVDVFNTQVVNQRLDTMTGEATIPDPSQPAKLLVSFPIAGTDQRTSTNYWVLATDYETYSLVYTCENIGNDQRAVFSWKLGREKTLPAAAHTAMNAVIATIPVLDSQYYAIRDQSDDGCFYYPVFQPGVPVVFPGQCDPNIPVQANFDPTRYVNLWHDIESYPSTFQQGTCNNAFYTLTPQSTVDVFNTQVVNQRLDTMTGEATIPDPSQPAKLLVSFPIAGTDQRTSTNYWVLATDYETYSLVYTCENIGNDQRAVFSWKLGREKTLPAAAHTAMNAVIATIPVLDSQYYAIRDQSDDGCFYYPVFQPGVPVVFPGQCDPNIPVQANFDPTRYVNLWHDIESYPSTFQQGTCNNAFYTLTNQGTVDVFNTQVIEQRLDTMIGEATIPDPSQPAKLLVTFPIAGTDLRTSTNYWVLSTDYVSYSLVYTCENLPNNQRAVFSWKLGREKTLPAAAHAAMDAVIATIPVLDSQYFANRDQSENGCFYFPDPQPGVPVVFPGTCDNSVAVAAGFNLQQFSGRWYEIEAYPKVQQSGTCVNHEFTTTTTANTLNLVSNQVVNQGVTSNSGQVVSVDGARLQLTMTVNGEVITFPYWVLATDHISYALVYSCIQINNDYRSVHSWKLSRTQSLPAAALPLIENAIGAVQVLDNQYFASIDQSAVGCFAYPSIPAGDPIILQGQCGTVTPVSNFSPSSFAGTWYEISRYPSARQSGSCAVTQFASTAQNTVTLTQTIVYNEELTVVTGVATVPADNSGVLTVTFTDGAGLSFQSTIYVLDVEYDDFAVLYSCQNLQGTNNRQVYSWKLSKSQAGLSAAANARIAQLVANNVDLYEDYFQTTGQTSNDCFYYPEFEGTPDAIILPGACPPVSGVANFVPADYLGNWYDVESYPIESQNGTCSRAEYTLVDGVITIRNTMVVNEVLRTQLGIARLTSTGTGVLQVTFVLENGEEVVSSYYILATDYTSFSLVYNCHDLGDGTRQVFSWKLSRTPTLTPAAINAINDVIADTQGLRQAYYQPSGQTDADCFYIPEYTPGQSVLFRGTCEEIGGTQFNANQYLGWWHEIERYPVDDTPGQCSSADFVQTGTAIQVVETSVEGGVANETTSPAVLAADGSITITRNGVATTWHVLTTDYTSYSLLYSCENVATGWGNYRRVWSAKHSKTRELSPTAQTTINNYIANSQLLHQHLYESVDQTASTCFHYREDASEQVILPGQCDNSIPVQANFDVTQFAGTWYQLERYPYPQVSNDGTCVGTRYTVNGDEFRVQNWEVLDGTLNTIEGTATVDAANAALTVTLPVQGTEETTTTVLRILLTNYDDYALAYTCVNINAFQRAIGAFKLSRSRTLSNNAQSAIQNYVNSREELHPPYFISVTQNEDCDEPSSAFIVKSSIIILLVCSFLQLFM